MNRLTEYVDKHDKSAVRSHILKENTCGKDHYVDEIVSKDDIVQTCMKCPPGKGDWYFPHQPLTPPNLRVSKHASDEQTDQLIMCSGGSTVTKDTIQSFDPDFKETVNNEPTWKVKQQGANIKKCPIVPHTGKVRFNDHRCPVKSPKHSGGLVPEEDRFSECVRKKYKDVSDENELMKKLTFLRTSDCHYLLPKDTDSCEKGFLDMFVSLPHEILNNNNKGHLKDGYRKEFDLSVRNMMKQSSEAESDRCQSVSDTTHSLIDDTKYTVDFKFPDISALWFAEDKDTFSGLYSFAQRFLNFMAVVVAIYIIGNLLLKITSRGVDTK